MDEILYSLPTIWAELPPLASPTGTGDALVLLEDDWRQVELVAVGLEDVIQAELQAVTAVWDEHARRGGSGFITGFDAIHVREQPAAPLPGPLSLRQVLGLLPPPARRYAGVAFAGAPEVAAGSFAADFGPVRLYGVADGDVPLVLGLDRQPGGDASPSAELVAGLREVLAQLQLVIVDWCRCGIAGPDSVAAYLDQ